MDWVIFLNKNSEIPPTIYENTSDISHCDQCLSTSKTSSSRATQASWIIRGNINNHSHFHFLHLHRIDNHCFENKYLVDHKQTSNNVLAFIILNTSLSNTICISHTLYIHTEQIFHFWDFTDCISLVKCIA